MVIERSPFENGPTRTVVNVGQKRLMIPILPNISSMNPDDIANLLDLRQHLYRLGPKSNQHAPIAHVLILLLTWLLEIHAGIHDFDPLTEFFIVVLVSGFAWHLGVDHYTVEVV